MLEIRNFELYTDRGILLQIPEISINEGQMMYLSGDNRTGKSLLITALNGDYHHYKGNLLLKHLPFQHKERKHRIIAITGTPRLFDDESIKNNLTFPSLKLTEQQWIKINEMLSEVRMDGLIHLPCGQLSASEKKIIEIVRAIIQYPYLLLFDDLDHYFDAEMYRIVKSWFRKLLTSGAVILATGKTECQSDLHYHIHQGRVELV